MNTNYVYLYGDSVVEGKTYKKMLLCKDELHENIEHIGLIREESHKTYFMPANYGKEILLYDFSLVEGDYFEIPILDNPEFSETFYVSSVDSVEIDGLAKKRMQIKKTPDGETIDTWIEELGSLNGLLFPGYEYFMVGAFSYLLCYFQEDELVYRNPKYTECYYNTVSIQEPPNKTKINVSPNPVTNQISITASEQIISSVEIFDASGKKVRSQFHGNSIDVTLLSKGFYWLKIHEVNGQVSTFKIIKN
jgi:hypothetical protein